MPPKVKVKKYTPLTYDMKKWETNVNLVADKNSIVEHIDNYIEGSISDYQDEVETAINGSEFRQWEENIQRVPEKGVYPLFSIDDDILYDFRDQRRKKIIDYANRVLKFAYQAAQRAAGEEDTGEGSSAAAKNVWREAMRTALSQGLTTRVPTDDIIDAWFNLTRAGGGDVDNDKLTAANARALYSEDWLVNHILVQGGDIQVFNPLTGARENGFANIINLGSRDRLFDNHLLNFVANFRGVGENAADNTIISDDEINNYQIDSPNHNFVLTAAQAGTAYNNGWTDHTDLQITDTGTLTVSINGIKRIEANPTVVSKVQVTWWTQMEGPAAGPRNQALDVDTLAHRNIMDAWFNLTVASGRGNIRDDQLTAANARQLWNNNWEAGDIQVHNGQPRVINPENGAPVDGFADINTLGNKNALVDFVTAFRTAGGDAVPADLTDDQIRAYIKHSDNGRHHLTGAQAWTIYNNGWKRPEWVRINNDGTIQSSLNGADDWDNNPLTITRRQAFKNKFLADFRAVEGLAADPRNIPDEGVWEYWTFVPNITGTQAGTAYNNGWNNCREIRLSRTGVFTVSVDRDLWLEADPTVLKRSQVVWRFQMSGGPQEPRNQALNIPEHNNIMDAWFNLTVASGRGNIRDDQLTAANARQLWNNNWEAGDIQAHEGQPRVEDPRTGAPKTGFVEIQALGNKNDLVDFVTAFRAVVKEAAALPDENVIRRWRKSSENGEHWLTGTQAGQAYNNGWIYNTDIRVNNNGTLWGQIVGTWVNADPTVISRDKASWRFNMGRDLTADPTPRGRGLQRDGVSEEDNRILDAWFEKAQTERILNDNLSAGGSRALWDNNWEAEDIHGERGDVYVNRPDTGEKIIGFNLIHNLGDKNNLIAGTAEEKALVDALKMKENNQVGIVNKLRKLIDLRDNHGATGTEAEQAAWNKDSQKLGNQVLEAITTLQPKQNIITALALMNRTPEERRDKITALENIQKNYPRGTPPEVVAWTWGKNEVEKVLNNLKAAQFLADFRAVGNDAVDETKIDNAAVDEYTKIISENGRYRITGEQAGQAYNNNWTRPKEIKIENDGTFRVSLSSGSPNSWIKQEVNPTTTTRRQAGYIFWRENMTAAKPIGPRRELPSNDVMDEWVNKTSFMGGPIDNKALGVRAARGLYSNNWEAADIIPGNAIKDSDKVDIRVIHPLTGKNVDGYVSIIKLGDKNKLKTSDFAADFRKAGGNAQTASADEISRFEALRSENGLAKLTGEAAGKLFNQGWEVANEIGINNDGTIFGIFHGDVTQGIKLNPNSNQIRAGAYYFYVSNLPETRQEERFNKLLKLNLGIVRIFQIGSWDQKRYWNANQDKINREYTRLRNLNLQDWKDVVSTVSADWFPGSRKEVPSEEVMENWFDLLKVGKGFIDLKNLLPNRFRALYSNNWEAAEIQNNGGDIRVINPTDGTPVDGYARIMNLGDKVNLANLVFRDAFRDVGGEAADPTQISNEQIVNYQKFSPHRNFRLDGATAANAFNNGWRNPTEINVTDAGRFEGVIGDAAPVDPQFSTREETWIKIVLLKGERTSAERAAKLADLEAITNYRRGNTRQQAAWNKDGNNRKVANRIRGLKEFQWFEKMGGPAAPFRNKALDASGATATDNNIMRAWFNLTESGGGRIGDDELTPANARTLWNNNWEWDNIGPDADHHDQLVVVRPDSGELVEGFVKIRDLGDRLSLIPEFNELKRRVGLPETNNGEVTAKLNALIDLRDNHGATGTEAEQAAWNKDSQKLGNQVLEAITTLQPKQNIITALALMNRTPEERRDKITALENIQKNYPRGTPPEVVAWTWGKNEVEKVLNNLKAAQFLADFRAVGNDAVDETKIDNAAVDEYTKIISENGRYRITGEQAGQAYNNNWTRPKEIKIENDGTFRVSLSSGSPNSWIKQEVNPTTTTRRQAGYIFWRENMTAAKPIGPRRELPSNDVMDEWVNKTSFMGGPIDNKALGVRAARGLYSNNWEAADIIPGNAIKDSDKVDIRVIHPLTGKNVDGYVSIIKLGDKNKLKTSDFAADFRKAGGNAQTASADEISRFEALRSENGLAKLTGEAAGKLFNQGWEVANEIGINNDGTIFGIFHGDVTQGIKLNPNSNQIRAGAYYFYVSNLPETRQEERFNKLLKLNLGIVRIFQIGSWDQKRYWNANQDKINREYTRLRNLNLQDWKDVVSTVSADWFPGSRKEVPSEEVMENWFDLLKVGKGFIDLKNLLPNRFRALYSNNWEAAEIQNNGGDIRVINPTDGTPVDGYARIMNLGDKVNLANLVFRDAFRDVGGEAADPTQISNEQIVNYQKFSPHRNFRLDGATAANAFNNGWRNPTEINVTDAGRFEGVIGDAAPVDPQFSTREETWIKIVLLKGERTSAERAAKLADLEAITNYRRGNTRQQAAWNKDGNNRKVANRIRGLKEFQWFEKMGGPAAPFRNKALDASGATATDNNIMRAWFNLTESGGGRIGDDELTPANARTLWNNNWEWDNIGPDADHHDQLVVVRPDSGELVEGFVKIRDLGDRLSLIPEFNELKRRVGLPETNNGEVTAKLNALIDLRDNHGVTGTPQERVAWNHGTNAANVNNAITTLQPKQNIIDALNMVEGADPQKAAKLTQLRTIQTTYPGGDDNHQNAWAFGNNQVEVENAIARLTAATPEVRALTDAVGMVETNDGEVNTKLTTLTALRTNYTAPGATAAQTAAWGAGTNATDVVAAIDRLTEVQNIRQALALPETNNGEVTAKLNALNPIHTNYPTGNAAQVAALGWGTNRRDVETAVNALTPKQNIIDALNMVEGADPQKAAKLTQLRTIQTTYPGGDDNHQNAWAFGNNQVEVENAIARLVAAFVAAFRAVGGNAGDNTKINDIEVANYWISSLDGGHVLTGTQAGNIFNNDWTDSNEIRITNEGHIQASLNRTDWNIDPLTTTKTDAVNKNQFITNFKTVAGPSASASDSNILDYFDKNLTPQQAATLYNGNPQVLGSELSKGTNNDEVKYNGQDYKTNNPDSIIAAKQAKIDADNAAKLAQAKTTAINAIQTLLDDTSNNQTKITDTEVKTQLNKTDNNLIDGTTLKDWKDYLNASSTTAEVSSREAKVKQAITAIREAHENPPFDAATARAAAISAVKDYWKTKSNDQTETGTVNGKKITEVLGTDWEREFNDKNDQVAIDSKKTELTGKIESEKSQEKENPAPVSAAEVEETLQEIVGNQEVKPSASVVSSWQEFNKPNSELKTASQIKQFLSENIKDKKVDFVSSLKDLPTAEQPAGKDDQEKITNLLTQKKAETVIKAIFSHKLKKEDSFRKEIETEMENKKDASGKVLDPQFYPKKDGKFTPEAMVNYLLQKKTGQAHKFATIQEQQGGNPKEQSHWDKHKFWYIGGTVLVVAAVGLAAVVWNSLKDLDKKELKTK